MTRIAGSPTRIAGALAGQGDGTARPASATAPQESAGTSSSGRPGPAASVTAVFSPEGGRSTASPLAMGLASMTHRRPGLGPIRAVAYHGGKRDYCAPLG
jgi:hypothetical protein